MSARPLRNDLEDGFDADDDFDFMDFGTPEVQAPAEPVDPFDLVDDDFQPSVVAAPVTQPLPMATPAAAHAINFSAADEAALGEASVPRIGIHAFCERPETAEMIRAAAGDRRLSRATVQVFDGGMVYALQHYQNQPTPSLIMVEGPPQAAQLLNMLDALSEVCDAGTKVIVLGAANDVALYRELIRRGVSEYLVPPFQPLALIRGITSLYADPSAPFLGRQIAFMGAKGGAGASTLAHNVAWTIGERIQASTVLVDFDLPFGTAGLDFNQDPVHGVADALSQPDRLDPVLLDRMMVRCSDKLSLFAAPATLDDDYDIGADVYEEVASKIRTTAPFVVVDLPHVWSGWVKRMLMASDELVVVATPDLASLRNAKNIIDLVRSARPNDAPPRLVLNQVGVPGRPEIPMKDFAGALNIEPVLVLPFDPKTFGQAANNGQMLEQTAAKSKAAEGVVHLAQMIARREAGAPAPKAKPASLLGKLIKRG